ncbi:translesion DNA synthesis-associated protein ImuA [Marinimicrobium alkaliphilum]|uniref:translesion DNA synthesis-associated protein ImuA n=1 Tax=Marinimicrobium alkaliphilum TaxID=2202654 RepID=UPI001300857A|nr:translesion DNA synthesis-associated protein ImuA [Marinimicrobium alkaliphilum]
MLSFDHPLIARGFQRPLAQSTPLTSGYPALDQALGGGWPATGVGLVETPLGIGELRLLLPLAQQVTQEHWLALINPPHPLQSDAWQHAGVDLERLLLIHTESGKKQLWSAEQCLKSGLCRLVITWCDRLTVTHIKRLQLAASEGDALLLVLRSPHARGGALPVHLRLQLRAHARGVQVAVLKQRGGWPVPAFVVAMHTHWPDLVVPERAPNITPFVRQPAARHAG